MLQPRLGLSGVGNDMKNAVFFHAIVEPKNWNRAYFCEVCDVDGSITPFRKGSQWEVTIDIQNGIVLDWPEDEFGEIHYRIEKAGQYFLLDANKNPIAKFIHRCVPNEFLHHPGEGWGESINLVVCTDGVISQYQKPTIDPKDWEVL